MIWANGKKERRLELSTHNLNIIVAERNCYVRNGWFSGHGGN